MAEEVLEEEQEEEECPKCPPAGAPAWMATFADMATLLMAFFVLILSFAEFNVPKFKQISGSLREAFGVQKVVPVVEQPKGTTVISLEFSPSPTPAITDTLRQQTTELQQPELELQTKTEDSPDGSETDKKNKSDFAGEGGEGAEQLDATELAKQLKKAIDTGEVTVETLGENVVINFPEEKTSLIIINVCCVVFFSLAPKRRIHPRERNVRDQRHFVAETYLRDGHRGWRRAWGEHSHFCGELSTSKRRMMCSRNFFVPTTLERERERKRRNTSSRNWRRRRKI